jgi:hypothetical protein
MVRKRLISVVICTAVAALSAACALYTDVSLAPLTVLPADLDRGTDVQQSIRKDDYVGAIGYAAAVSARPKPNGDEVAALGAAYLAAGRYDEARRQLRAALDLKPLHTTSAQIAWNLSQVEYMQNNYAASLEWANSAVEQGLGVHRWHRDYLAALAEVDVYHFPGRTTARLPMRIGKPDVPRVDVNVDGHEANAIIDSGAVLTIISRQLADSIPIRRLGTFRGAFYGLVGEPIAVEFGLITELQLGDMAIRNVPVAIMPDAKMRFMASGQKLMHMQLLLGANLLKEFRLELDYGRERATFTRLTARDRVVDPQQNLFISGFRPHVRGLIQRKGWFLFILDTGSEVTFLNDTITQKVPMSAFGTGFHAANMQGLGGSQKRGTKVENVEVGIDTWAGTFKTLPMYGTDENERAAGILGENFLRNFTVTLDFGRMRLDLRRR